MRVSRRVNEISRAKFRARRPENAEAALFRRFLREGAVILLDRLSEAGGNFVGSRQREPLVVGSDPFSQLELESLQMIDRGLQLLQPLRIAARLKRLQLTDHRLE